MESFEGQQPSGSLSSPTSGKTIVLRIGLLAGLTASAAAGIYSCSPKDGADKTGMQQENRNIDVMPFDALAQALTREFGPAVREVKQAGPRVVIVLADRHVDTVRDLTMRRLEILATKYGVRRIGLEGVIDFPDSPAEQEITKSNDRILKLPDGKFLELPENAPGAMALPMRPGWGSYRTLFKDQRFAVTGLEDAKLMQRAPLAVEAEEIIDLLLDTVIRGYIPVQHKGKMHPEILRYLQIQEAFHDDPLFPRLDLQRLKHRKEDVVLLGKEDTPLIGKLAVEFTHWRDERLNFPRNTVAADRMTDFIKGETRPTALLFGRRHTDRSVENIADGKKTLQQELLDRGVSVVVVDPE